MSKKNKNSLLSGLLGSILTLFIAVLFYHPPTQLSAFIKRFDHLLYDIRFKMVPRAAITQIKQARANDQLSDDLLDIVIVDIDEKSLLEQGQWPWSRAKIAQLLQNIQNYGALIVGFDILFAEPEQNPVDVLSGLVKLGSELTAQLDRVRYQIDPDAKLAAQMGSVETVLGFFWHGLEGVNSGVLPIPIGPALGPKGKSLVVLREQNYSANLRILQSQALGAGFLTAYPDEDGVIRRVPLVIEYERALYPALALELARQIWLLEKVDFQTALLQSSRGQQEILEALNLGKYRIPTDEAGQVLIPFLGPQGSFPYVSATDILMGRLAEQELYNKVILVGTSALGLKDLRTTVVGTGYPGVEVHANVLSAILNLPHYPKAFAFRPDYESLITAFLVLVTGLLLAWSQPFLNPTRLVGFSFLVLVGLVFINYYLWYEESVDFSLAPPLVLWCVLSFFNFADGFLLENIKRNQIKAMFGQYVPPAHIEEMLESEDNYTFEGASKVMTVMFSDIRNFTTISEGLTALELTNMLNQFFTPITEIIFQYKGTIDKYVGDMVMAFWGAPLDDHAHAQHAVLAGLDMLVAVGRLKEDFKKLGLPEINIGIGINTGMMNVGDMGSTYRRAYTVLGDAVNLGSRLEGVTKFYGVKMLVSEQTQAACPDVLFRLVDRIKVKGKQKPVQVYEPIGIIERVSCEQQLAVARFHYALYYYFHQQWDEARGIILDLQQGGSINYKSDCSIPLLYQLYLDRIEALREENLIETSWNGVYIHTSK